MKRALTTIVVMMGLAALSLGQVSPSLITVDCGSPSDAGFTSPTNLPSFAFTLPQPVAVTPPGTNDATLRFGTNFTYTFPITTPGLYLVDIKMIEPSSTAPGQRVFSVLVQDQPVIQNLDLFASAGLLVPTSRDIPVFLTGPTARVQFLANPLVAHPYAVVQSITIYPLNAWMGPQGFISQQIFVYNESETLQPDGTFTIGWSKLVPSGAILVYMQVWRNGLLQKQDDDYSPLNGASPVTVLTNWPTSGAPDTIIATFEFMVPANTILIAR